MLKSYAKKVEEVKSKIAVKKQPQLLQSNIEFFTAKTAIGKLTKRLHGAKSPLSTKPPPFL